MVIPITQHVQIAGVPPRRILSRACTMHFQKQVFLYLFVDMAVYGLLLT
jgi:hypothetical protein